MGRKLILELTNDPDARNPLPDMGWKYVHFRQGFEGCEDKEDYLVWKDGGYRANRSLQGKIERGTAFFVSLYEHSGRSWTVTSDTEWSDQVDGILFCNTSCITRPERLAMAEGVMKMYEAWAEGAVYAFILSEARDAIEKATGREVKGGLKVEIDSCCGFYDSSTLFATLREEHFREGDKVEVEGEAAWLMRFEDISPAKIASECEDED